MDFRILIHSQDAQLFLLLQHVLATEGFAASLTDGLDEIASDVGAAIVDCSRIGQDLYSLDTLRAKSREIALILLLNETAESARPLIEKAKADLVLGRPFDPALLVSFLRRLRLNALIEKGRPASASHVLRFGDLEMNTATVRVYRNGQDIPLTALQFRLLRHLMQHPAAVQSREQLIEAGWPRDVDVEPRTVDIHMGHIRRTLKMFGPDLIRTVRTLGYALDVTCPS